MKNFWKKIGVGLIFLAGFVGLLIGLSYLVTPDNVNIYDVVNVNKKQQAFDKERADSIDVLFIGDSETYAAFNPIQMYEEQGFTSYVMGTSAQRLCDTYELLSYALKTQNPKVVLLEANTLFRPAGNNVEEDDKDVDKVQNFLAERFAVFTFHSRWKTPLIGFMNRKNDFEAEGNNKGFRVREETKAFEGGEYMAPTDYVRGFSVGVNEYLNKIRDLCAEKNIEFAIISAPSVICWNYPKHNGVLEYADSNGLEYYDLNVEPLGIDWKYDTKDGGDHVNYSGACKTGTFLGKMLDERYELPDHRSEADYSSWSELSKEFFEMYPMKQ